MALSRFRWWSSPSTMPTRWTPACARWTGPRRSWCWIRARPMRQWRSPSVTARGCTRSRSTGYGPQKQRAIDMARHRLDPQPGCRRNPLAGHAPGHRAGAAAPWVRGIPPASTRAHVLDRATSPQLAQCAPAPVRSPSRQHERCGGACGGGSGRTGKTLHQADFVNAGDADIATRVDKINRYSSGMVAHKLRRASAFHRLADGLLSAGFLPAPVHRQALFPQWLGRLHRQRDRRVLRLPQVREIARGAAKPRVGLMSLRP